MLEKMLGALKARYSNLGLSEEVLKSVASMAIIGLDESADDAAIAARASEGYVSDSLKTLQSQFDKVRGEGKRSIKEEPKGEKHEPIEGGAMEEVLSLLKEQKAANESMRSRLDALENAGKVKSFDEMVSRVGKELKMSASILDLCKQGLSSDMDETAVRNALGAKKKALIDEGIKFDDQSGHLSGTQTQAEQEEASQWVEHNKIV